MTLHVDFAPFNHTDLGAGYDEGYGRKERPPAEALGDHFVRGVVSPEGLEPSTR